jgi:hypothetical protein
MYRQCDDCKGIFFLTRTIEKYSEKHPKKVIYCPFCNGVYSHIHNKQFKTDILMSKRGKIF